MRTCAAEPIGSVDFLPFGEHVRLEVGARGVDVASGDGWQDLSTQAEVVTGPAQVGMTVAVGPPIVSTRMERHRNTREVVVCMADPVVLVVAPSSEGAAPDADQVRAVTLDPGDVAILSAGTWHDACRGVTGPAKYLWLAGRVEGDDADWVSITDGPVEIRC